MQRLLVLAGLMVVLTAWSGIAAEPSPQTGDATPLQAALRDGDHARVMTLLTTTQAAYTETFTHGSGPLATPLPQDALDQAWGVLVELMRDHPQAPRLNFLIGMLSIKRNDLARAELAFERVLQAEPDNLRTEVELARVCALSGRHEMARTHYQHVLNQNPPAPVVHKIKGHLTQLDRTANRFHVSVRLDAGALVDDNVNVGPNSDTVAVAPLTVGPTLFTELAVAPESQPVSANGAYAAASVEMLHDAGRPGRWGWTADLNYYENWLNQTAYETRLVRGAVGVKHADKRGLFKGSLRIGRIWDGPDPLLDTVGILPAYLRSYKPGGYKLYWISALLAEHREYDSRNGYDGLYLGLEQTARLMLTDHASLYIGFRVADKDAAAPIYAYTGLSGVTGATATWGRLSLDASVRYTRNDYDKREVLAPEPRVDDQWLINAKASLRLLGHVGVEVKHQYTDSQSTFDLYEYDRNLTMAGLWGRF